MGRDWRAAGQGSRGRYQADETVKQEAGKTENFNKV